MNQATSTAQLELFPEWNKNQDFIDSWRWKNNEEASFALKEDVIKPAFKALRLKDYICRMNFSCCGGCASYELHRMAKEREKEGVIYWHRQDQERMVSDRVLYLGYGSVDDKSLSSTDVGRHTVEALQKQVNDSGLPVIIGWDGDVKSRIKLTW